MPVRIIFICYENICRSPMAEALFFDLLVRHDLQHFFSVGSAGTVSYQEGSPPDDRAIAALKPFGIDISSARARCAWDLDLHDHDWIFTMDHENFEEVSTFFSSQKKPEIHGVMEFVDGRAGEELSDPYYGTFRDFEAVAKDLSTACAEILQRMFEHYPYLAEH